jgi:hypothetical protein
MRQEVDTDVNVTAIIINLPAPQLINSGYIINIPGQPPQVVPERDDRTIINCTILNHPSAPLGTMPPYRARGLRVRVRSSVDIPPGTPVTLRFEGRREAPDGPLIPGTEIAPAALPMPATGNLDFWLDDYARLKACQFPAGSPPVRPDPPNYARISYTAGGIEAVATFAVQLLNGSLVYCEVERPEP